MALLSPPSPPPPHQNINNNKLISYLYSYMYNVPASIDYYSRKNLILKQGHLVRWRHLTCSCSQRHTTFHTPTKAMYVYHYVMPAEVTNIFLPGGTPIRVILNPFFFLRMACVLQFCLVRGFGNTTNIFLHPIFFLTLQYLLFYQ